MGYVQTVAYHRSGYALGNVGPYWQALTGSDNYNLSFAKASQLQSPALRFRHCLLTNTIYGRMESLGVVTWDKLYILYNMS